MRPTNPQSHWCEELIVAYREGFRVIFIVGAGLAATATLIVVCLMPQVHLDRPDDEKLKEEGKKANQESKALSTPLNNTWGVCTQRSNSYSIDLERRTTPVLSAATLCVGWVNIETLKCESLHMPRHISDNSRTGDTSRPQASSLMFSFRLWHGNHSV